MDPLTPQALRVAAADSVRLMMSLPAPAWLAVVRDGGDPLLTLLPGNGGQKATRAQVLVTEQALAPQGLPHRADSTGAPVWPNVAFLRSNLRRAAALPADEPGDDQPAAAVVTPDPAIEREIAWAVDGALGVLFARLDELRVRRGLSDAAMLHALGGYGCTDLADGYAEWIREGES